MANAAQQDARSLIERIKSEYTLDRAVVGPRFEKLVSNSLEVLSSQLYEKSTHFLLEILQNADDNTYNTPTPTLNFSYAPGSLRIDCNEVGFTADNVEAICAINQSTKSDKKTDGEYIGEKGIGFKSVFKAADVAWISSREYKFKFDQTKFLGMVTPIWAEFPEKIRPGWTSILLSLSKGFEEGNLVRELLTFDANLLIFLRQVKEIHISVAGELEYKEQKITKCENQQGHDRIIILRAGSVTNRYLVRTYIIENLPREKKRLNWNRTKILLGFPVAESHEAPQHAPQKVYAFLPVRSYGLKFLLQADFLLTASREDIESTLPWNCRLRDAVAEAFLESVHHFNTGEMKYIWPWYLPDPLTTTNSFFDIAIESIMKILRELPVLESCAGTMEKAESLKSVPSDSYVDGSGTPFTLSSRTATKYLSSTYTTWAVQGTRSIGVSKLSSREFLEDLESLINEDPQSFYTKPPLWHAQLAESLYKLTTDDKLLALMQEIYPIPLQDGTWTSAHGKSMFFAKGESSLEVPSGIDVLIVDETAESDANRRRLLVSLGVKAWAAPEICRLILRVHESPGFDAKTLTADQLISHAAFLYKASWQPPKDVDIWFATMQDERCLGRKLYVAGSITSDSPASRVFAKLQERFPVIHNGYLEAFSSDVKWPHWLVKNLGLSMVPRLITPLIEPKPQAVLKTHAPGSSSRATNEDADATATGSVTSGFYGTTALLKDAQPPEDYQKQLMLLEQQNKKRLLMAQQDQDSMLAHRHETLSSSLPPLLSPPLRPPGNIEPNIFNLLGDRRVSFEDPIFHNLNDVGFDHGRAPVLTEAQSQQSFREMFQQQQQTETQAMKQQQQAAIRHQQQLQQQQQQQGAMSPQQLEVMRQQQQMAMSPQQLAAMRHQQQQLQQQAVMNPQQLEVMRQRQMAAVSQQQQAALRQQQQQQQQALAQARAQVLVQQRLEIDSLSERSGDEDRIAEETRDGDVKTIFTLSDEFVYIFSECRSSDALQILRDNWHHYSQWIDGAHMTWQDPEFVTSSVQLKNRIGSCVVRSASGPVPLRETVLPAIDPQLDRGCFIPAVDVLDPKHPDWRLLGSFGVLLIADVQYYFRCLISVSEHDHMDIDHVAYIYEKIQSFYRGNEPLIHAAFFERNVVLTRGRPSKSSKSSVWTDMKDCLAQNIAIEYEYPSCSYLFRCLGSPSGDPIASLVATASLITSSSKLGDVSRLFRNISKALKDVTSSQAAELLRPLQKLTVFPIINESGDRTYDKLSSMDDASWFVADRPQIRKSFHSKLPLLALSTGDIAASEDLLRVLRLDNRLLSKLATNRTCPLGRVKTHWDWTSSLRAKRPFFRALIPQSHSNRATIMHRIENIRGSVAPFISQIYEMKASGVTVEGSSVSGQTSLSITGNSLNLFLNEETAAAESPPYELSILLADQLEIKDVNHRSLLYTVLISSNSESIYSTFVQQGIEVDGLVFGEKPTGYYHLSILETNDATDKSRSRYRAQRGDLSRIPSPFWGNTARFGGSGSGTSDVLRFDRFRSWRHNHASNEDRRLPMNKVMRLDRSLVEDVQAVPARLIGWEHTQHLGEHLAKASKILQTHLGHLYNPERHWTSELRCRSGHKPMADSDSYASFTLGGPEIAKQMTAFVTSFGQSPIPYGIAALRKGSPVYHLDVVVNSGSKTSSFVLGTSQIERFRKYAMSDEDTELNTDIALLLKISDVYSSNASSAELVIDPWRLFCSSDLQLETEWLISGTLKHDSLEPARKRRKLPTLSVPWLAEGNLATRQHRSTSSLVPAKRPVFSHQPLRSKEIRLINVLPGTQQDQLQGVIIHVQSASAPPYRALSYVWGTDQQTKELVTPDGILPITSSLSKALHSLRRKDQSITLWVDAICINQKDGREKEKQIRMLPVIFQNASFTYAFLEGGNGSDSALEMLMQVRAKAANDERSRLRQSPDPEKCIEDETDLQNGAYSTEDTLSESAGSTDETEEEDWPEDLPPVPDSWRDNPIPHLDDEIWISVMALFSLPFFRRVWIVQEVVAALNVKIVCGTWTIDWSDLHLAIEVVDRQIQLFDTDTTHLSSSWEPFLSLAAQREWEARSHRWTLSMLLENFRYTESTLSRDRLFAMLGLASDGNEADFEPDYASPLEDIVLRFARVFVRQGRGMQLLYRAGLHGDTHRFPSWIPDWTIKRSASLADVSEGGIAFGASGPQQPMIKCLPDSDELLVDGYAVDVIESISTSTNVEEGLAAYFTEVDAMINHATLHPTQTPREDLYWKVPIAGALFPKVAISGGVDLRSSYTALRRSLSHKGKGKSVDNEVGFVGCDNNHLGAYTMVLERLAANSYRNEGLGYLAALQDTVQGWRFVVTKKGHVGTVPNLAQAGDVVAIMKGGRVPFILQKSKARSEAFRLVGECYVHGLMNGEGLSLPDVVETTFTLH